MAGLDYRGHVTSPKAPCRQLHRSQCSLLVYYLVLLTTAAQPPFSAVGMRPRPVSVVRRAVLHLSRMDTTGHHVDVRERLSFEIIIVDGEG